MASEQHSDRKPQGRAAGTIKAQAAPDWAGGLKQLYDSVVEEPLPDAFKDLLDKLDDGAMPLPDGDDVSDGASGKAS